MDNEGEAAPLMCNFAIISMGLSVNCIQIGSVTTYCEVAIVGDIYGYSGDIDGLASGLLPESSGLTEINRIGDRRDGSGVN